MPRTPRLPWRIGRGRPAELPAVLLVREIAEIAAALGHDEDGLWIWARSGSIARAPSAWHVHLLR